MLFYSVAVLLLQVVFLELYSYYFYYYLCITAEESNFQGNNNDEPREETPKAKDDSESKDSESQGINTQPTSSNSGTDASMEGNQEMSLVSDQTSPQRDKNKKVGKQVAVQMEKNETQSAASSTKKKKEEELRKQKRMNLQKTVSGKAQPPRSASRSSSRKNKNSK